jgi:GT2 family glycosyltransferase
MEASGISLVIPNWNGRRWLGACLDSIRSQTAAPAEIIVVDDGSTDDSVAFVRANYPEVRLEILPENHGFCRAANAGLRVATQDAILLLNNDARMHPECLRVLEGALRAFPEAYFFALQVLQASGDIIDSAGAAITRDGRLLPRNYGLPAPTFDSQTLDSKMARPFGPPWRSHSDLATPDSLSVFGNSGGAGLYRRRLFEDVGLFDEDFVMYLEDVDMDFRARLRNHLCLYLPEAIIYHLGSATLGAANPRVVSLLIRNHLLVLAKSLPTNLWLKDFPRLLRAQIRSGAFYAGQGQAKIFLAAMARALFEIPKILRKRQAIQSNRLLSEAELLRLMEP